MELGHELRGVGVGVGGRGGGGGGGMNFGKWERVNSEVRGWA